MVQRKLAWSESDVEIVEIEHPIGPGNIVVLEVAYENVTEVFTGFGEVGRAAEAVATNAVRQCLRYLRSDAPIGEYLTDQLMLPMAISGRGSFQSIGLSRHAETHIELIGKFLELPIRTQREDSGVVNVLFG